MSPEEIDDLPKLTTKSRNTVRIAYSWNVANRGAKRRLHVDLVWQTYPPSEADEQEAAHWIESLIDGKVTEHRYDAIPCGHCGELVTDPKTHVCPREAA